MASGAPAVRRRSCGQGQSVRSACCGAAKAAAGKLERGEIVSGEVTELDYQQNTIERIFLAKRERILGAPDRLVEATEVMYEAIEARIDALASRTTYPCTHVVLMGAILINADHDAGSCASLRRLRYLNVKTGASLDSTGEYRSRGRFAAR